MQRFNKRSEGIEIKFTDSKIIYKDFESFFEMAWTVFSEYKIYRDYLFLMGEKNFFNSIVIKRNEVSADKFSELLEFVKKKLIRKE